MEQSRINVGLSRCMIRHATARRIVIGGMLLLGCAITLSTSAAEPRATKSSKQQVPTTQLDETEETLPASFSEVVKAERQVAKKPRDRKARLDAARAHLQEDADKPSNVVTAKDYAQEVLREYPNDIDALLIAAQTSLLQGDVKSAANYYRAAAAVDHNNAVAYLGLGDMLGRLGDDIGSTAAFARYRVLMGMQPLATK